MHWVNLEDKIIYKMAQKYDDAKSLVVFSPEARDGGFTEDSREASVHGCL